jgi:hypothetical protein
MATGLPDEDSKKNGLVGVMKTLIEHYQDEIIAVVVLDSSGLNIDHVKHTRTPTVRVKHIEPMITAAMVEQAQELIGRAYRDRTSEQLELDLFPPKGAIQPLAQGWVR